MRRLILLAAIPAALLAGCSGAPATATSSPSASVPSTAPSATTAASSPAAPTPTSAPTLGTAQTMTGDDDIATTVTVTTYKVITLSAENQELLPGGTRVALIQVRQCVAADAPGPVSMSWSPWILITAQSETLTPLDAYGTRDFPGPLYDNDENAAVAAGQCRAGLIPFSLQHVTDAVAQVEYTGYDQPMTWSIG